MNYYFSHHGLHVAIAKAPCLLRGLNKTNKDLGNKLTVVVSHCAVPMEGGWESCSHGRGGAAAAASVRSSQVDGTDSGGGVY